MTAICYRPHKASARSNPMTPSNPDNPSNPSNPSNPNNSKNPETERAPTRSLLRALQPLLSPLVASASSELSPSANSALQPLLSPLISSANSALLPWLLALIRSLGLFGF
jgi:hypothetical protein